MNHFEMRLKYVATLNNEALGEDTDPDYELHYIDIGNVDSSGQIHEFATYRFGDAPSRARRRVRNGDVIVSCVRTYLQAIAPIESAPGNLIVSTGFAVVRPIEGKLRPGFCKYALREPHFLAEVERRSVGVSYPAINSFDLATIPIPAPPDDVQRRIETFLDRETARLDALIAAKLRFLELLGEKRKALIATAVTRGLDLTVKLRDSGVAWLGEIPARWELWKVGHLARVGNGSTPERDKAAYWTEGTFPWLNSSVVNRNEVTSSDQVVTEAALRECHLPRLQPGTVLVAITGQGKTRGRAVVLSIEATINQHIAFVSADSKLADSWFLRWSFYRAYDYLRSISDDAGGTKGALTCEDVASLKVPLPPLAEQRAIVEHIARETAKLDAVRAAAERTIALLKERRFALIAAAVTGKLDVEDAA